MRRPIVIVPACVNQIGAHPYHTVQDKYINAVANGARCMPLILPALGAGTDLESLLASADGIMLTGSPSHVDPGLYGQSWQDPAAPQDALRDATTLPLIRAALKRAIPLLAICRGFQEVNVALGGTLHQALHDVEGLRDHREDKSLPLDAQYGPAHHVALEPHGRLSHILCGASSLSVNSLHTQGVAQLAPGLSVEARADDGLVEAFTVAGAAGFMLAVQWHPEWRLADNPASVKLFLAFGDACRAYQQNRLARESGKGGAA